MSIGFAFLFTPLFTVSLSSVAAEPLFARQRCARLDPAGGGRRGRGAARRRHDRPQAALATAGAAPVDALAGGIRMAFLVGAILSLFAVLTAFFIRKPADQPMPGGHGSH